MCDLVTEWAATNSGSGNLAGLKKVGAMLAHAFGSLGGTLREIELQPQKVLDNSGEMREFPLGNALSIRKRPHAPLQVFLGAHMDTVYGVDHEFQSVVTVDGTLLRGPGVTDAKGGVAIMLVALEAFERTPFAERVGWEVLITPDEELGSPGSSVFLNRSAKRNLLGLVFEPAFSDGALVSARKGSGNFTALVRGRAAHAGRAPDSGRNAINALAGFVIELQNVQTETKGVTVNVGFISGGGPVNVVPDFAIGRFNVRVETPEEQRIILTRIQEIAASVNEQEGITLELHGSFTRPPKTVDNATARLQSMVTACGCELGLTLRWRTSGGACDGNNLTAAGLPTVDSMGARGDGMHSREEVLYLDSLVERAQLAALLFMKLGSGEIEWNGVQP